MGGQRSHGRHVGVSFGANLRLSCTGRGFDERPVVSFTLGQLVRRDSTECGSVALESGWRFGQRVWALEPKTARRQRTKQQGAAQVGPLVYVRLDPGGSSEGESRQVHPSFLGRPSVRAGSN